MRIPFIGVRARGARDQRSSDSGAAARRGSGVATTADAAPRRRTNQAAAADAAAATTATAPAPAAAAEPLPTSCTALIVGGGPAGLAAALQLSARGWRDVVVVERREAVAYADADRSYVYNIDGRGRRLLDRHGLGGALEEAGVSTAVVELTRVYPDGRKEQRSQTVKDATRATHWLPRPTFVGLLAAALEAAPHAARVRVVTSAAVTAVRRVVGGGSSGSESVEVDVEGPGGATVTLRPALLLGCDGVASPVRAALQEWAAEDAAMRAAAGTFEARALPCPSAGLRFKVLPLPPQPRLRDGTVLANSGFALLQGRPSARLGGRGAPAVRLGLLPFKDAAAPRTANLITVEGHPIWDIEDAESMYAALEDALPQADWRALVPAETMARFAASRGGAFPAPTFSDGAGAAIGDGGSGGGRGTAVLLLGDALHCFPPDLGQGVNAALLDVLGLDAALDAAAAVAAGKEQQGQQQQQQQQRGEEQGEGPEGVDLAALAAEFQRRQRPQAEALCRLLPVSETTPPLLLW